MQYFQANFFTKLPIALFLLIFLNSLYGILILYSAGFNNFEPWAFKQMLNFLIFFPIMLVVAMIDIKLIYRFSYLSYLIVLALLVAVHFFGHTAMGAKRWLGFAGFRIQPSELAKIAMVLFLARYFHTMKAENITKIWHLIPAVIAVILPMILIVKQPDLGTAIVILGVSIMIFFAAGVKFWKFITLFIGIIISFPIIWMNMHEYQKKRIEVFLDPDQDRLGSSYNIIQSKIAIGSGGFWGNGLGKGTQSHLSFLPEHQTDFIFACLSEDLGFVGGFILLLIYGLIIYLSTAIAINAKSMFTRILVVGITSIYFFHIFINIGMVTGIMPVVGIPLPLISYGGTMVGSILVGFGFVMNAHINQRIKI